MPYTSEGVFWLPAALDLQSADDDWLDARAYRTLLDTHTNALAAVSANLCSPACLAATDPYGECQCVCRGGFHATLWARDVLREVD